MYIFYVGLYKYSDTEEHYLTLNKVEKFTFRQILSYILGQKSQGRVNSDIIHFLPAYSRLDI